MKAAAIAFEAGQLLLALREQLLDPGALGSATADVSSNKLIRERLCEHFPDDGVLSEESPDNSDRLSRRRVWIVDPLDGTREFGEPPRDDWAVHVALAAGHTLRTGAVAIPAKGMLFTTAAPLAPSEGPVGQSCKRSGAGPLRIAVSRTRPPAEATLLSEQLGAELVPMGSAGVKTMAVLRGEVDAYVHSGGQYEWDSAAPVAIAQLNGLHASRLDGSLFRWNQPSPWLPDLLVCRPEHARSILGVLGAPPPRSRRPGRRRATEQ